MKLDGLHALLVDFDETLTGLRTGQVGRANAYFVQLLNKLSLRFEHLPPALQPRAAAVVGAMRAARERDDTVTLADALQYELPALLDGDELPKCLFDLPLIAHLRKLHAGRAATGGIDAIAQAIRTINRERPEIRGLAAFFAGPMCRDGDHAAAHRLLQVDEADRRRTPANGYLLALTQARSGDFATAEATMLWAYERALSLRDGFARLGWVKSEAKDWPAALALALRDQAENRLSPPWQVNLAQIHGRLGKFDRAVGLLDAAYAQNRELLDGFARLGWIHAEGGRWSDALVLGQRDEAAGRLSPTWQVNLAQLYARRGDYAHAASLVEAAYDRNPELRDGYARLAWIRAADATWRAALEIAQRDEAAGRLSPAWQLNVAQLHGRVGDWVRAVALVEAAYAVDGGLCDGFARLGWKRHQAGDTRGAVELATRDRDADRLGSHGLSLLGLLHAHLGDFACARALIDKAYAQDPKLNDGYATLGWILIESGQAADGLATMQRDIAQGRMSPAWRENYERVLADRDWRPAPTLRAPAVQLT